ncbi:MAG: DEAD/DEAH box helicase, partial [Bacteroidetes bacterium]|nr:DEAD/DEAH box helicase [Bacteroidota bacterium]
TDARGLKKLGLTIHPVHRLRQYAIGDAPGCGLEKHYNGLWKIEVNSRAELREMEAILHNYFADRRQGTTEWFRVTFEEVSSFMNSPQKFKVKQVSFDEVKLINTKYKEPINNNEQKEYDDENEVRKEQEARPVKSAETVYEKFLRVFLPGKLPRRIQTELWGLFQEICRNPEHISYRAIVQWPTGVGKTIATLMLIVIAAERCKARGEIYRGLFVSPKNDIIDTISKDFNKLSEFGISVYDGAHGKLSSLTIPTNCHIVISACQAALINDKGMRRLPHMTHVHYDEVHRITGEQYFQLLKEMLIKWNTEFLTGTSATPKTCSKSQHDKLAELFGEPYTILHKCDVEEAVKERWIAKPRYVVSITAKHDDRAVELDACLVSISKAIQQKKEAGHWNGGKVIVYSPDSVEDVRYLTNQATNMIPGAIIYSAIDGLRTDDQFIKAAADGTVRILFACQRFREGSDVKGLDMTCALVGNTTAVYILLQMCGRALRLDYEGKEGWCLIVRPSDQGTTEEDVLASIILDIIEFLGDSKKKREVKELEPLIKTFLGEVNVSGSSLSLEETIKRVQAAYVRRLYIRQKKAVDGLSYKDLVSNVHSLGINSRSDYSEKALLNELPDTPSDIRGWISWYDLLRASHSDKRMTLYDLQKFCKDNYILTKEDYILRADCPPWDDLIDGYLTDLPSPMPSHLETELFKSGRGGRR